MFKYFLISIIIAPLMVGVTAAAAGESVRRYLLRMGWITYAVLWFGVLYYLRYRWS